MTRFLSIIAVVLLSIGLFAMGTQDVFPTVNNTIATDGDNIPKERRDPPKATNDFQYSDNALATDGDNIPKERRDPPKATLDFQNVNNALA